MESIRREDFPVALQIDDILYCAGKRFQLANNLGGLLMDLPTFRRYNTNQSQLQAIVVVLAQCDVMLLEGRLDLLDEKTVIDDLL